MKKMKRKDKSRKTTTTTTTTKEGHLGVGTSLVFVARKFRG